MIMLQTELNRRRVMSAISGGMNYQPYLSFSSKTTGNISIRARKTWDGRLEYSLNDGETWLEWSGSEIQRSNGAILLRGKDNTKIKGTGTYNDYWVVTSNSHDVIITGDIRTLLNYEDIENINVAEYCFLGMFRYQTDIISSPVLGIKTLPLGCYAYMFENCSFLNEVTMLATDISTQSCLDGWMTNVAASGTFYKDASMTTLPTGTNGIPSGWTVEDYVG